MDAGIDRSAPRLARVITLWPLMLYGLGEIVGAGIYVAVGSVVDRAGDATPLAFVAAGIVAALTGLCYAELSSRFPKAGGAAIYVGHAFGPAMSRLAGATLTFATAVAAATIARGAVSYLAMLVPLPGSLLVAIVIVSFVVIAVIGIRVSVGLAAAIGAIEIGGIAAATFYGWFNAADPWPHVMAMAPWAVGSWGGVASGAFIAFFAYIGFENLSNLSEEVKDPRRAIPQGILGSVALSIVLYVGFATAVVVSSHGGRRPEAASFLALISATSSPAAEIFIAIGFLAVANGVLAQIVMLARLFYGMADEGYLPDLLARINPRTKTPINATIMVGAIVLAAAVLVSFEDLLVVADVAALLVFLLVTSALWRIKRRAPAPDGVFVAPGWVPPLAAAASLALVLAEFAR